MGKKRGGKNRNKNKPEISGNEENDSEDQSTTPQCSGVTEYLINHQYEPDDHDQYRRLGEYVKTVQPLVDSILQELAEGKSNVIDERGLLLKRIFKEFKGKETAVIRDQRGSKVMEKILMLLRQIVEEVISNPKFDFNDVNNDNYTVLDGLNSVKGLIRSISGDVYDNCTSCYASHCIQTLLGIVPLYVSIENRIQPKINNDSEVSFPTEDPSDESHPTENDSPTGGTLSLEETVLYFFGVLRVTGIRLFMSHPCASHVVRSAFLMLAGYTPDQPFKQFSLFLASASRRPLQSKDRLPSRRLLMPNHFEVILVSVFENMIESVSSERLTYALDPYANPVLQISLQILSSLGAPSSELQSGFVSLYLPNDLNTANTLADQLDSLLDSPIGSRLIECCLSCATPAHIHSVIWYYLKPSQRLNRISTSRYGNYFIQQLLSNKCLDIHGLKCLIEEMNFKNVIKSKCSGVIRHFVDACRRIRDGYKIFVTVGRSKLRDSFSKLLDSLELHISDHFPLLWWSLLSCRSPWDLPRSLVELVDTPRAKEALSRRDLEATDQLIIDPTGCSITAGLLQFPKDSIIPLLQAFKPFASSKHHDYLLAVAKDRQGSWLFQAVLVSTEFVPERKSQGLIVDKFSPIDQKSQARLVRLFLGQFSQLAFHPYGSFFVSAGYEMSPIDLKKSIIEELRGKADELKHANFALYNKIEFCKYLEQDEVWKTDQHKKTKIRNLFADIVDPSSEPEKKKGNGKSKHNLRETSVEKTEKKEKKKKKYSESDDKQFKENSSAQLEEDENSSVRLKRPRLLSQGSSEVERRSAKKKKERKTHKRDC